MSKKTNRNKPGALEEYLERQELGTNPTKVVGNFRPSMPIFLLGRFPLFKLLLGICCGVPAIIGLISTLHDLAGNWLNLITITVMIALSVLLLISGIRSLRPKGGKRKSRQAD